MDESIWERVGEVVGLLGTVLGIGTAGYHLIEGWPVFDAFYMTVITVATVGYGEVHPLSHAGRAFTVCLILAGLGVTAYAFSQLTAIIVEGDLSSVMRRKKMEKRIQALTKHFILCGAGNTGRTVLDELVRTERSVVVVDKDPEVCQQQTETGRLVIQGDAHHDDILKAAGVYKARGVFCALGSDQDNLLLTLAARELNSSVRIVSEVHDARFRERLLRCGADGVVDSPHIGGLRMASEMVRPVTVGFLDAMIRDRKQTYRFEEVTLAEASRLAGTALSALELGGGRAPAVVAVKDKASGGYAINPPGDRRLSPGDTLVVLGSTEEIARLKAAA